jgi:hypothetical protein
LRIRTNIYEIGRFRISDEIQYKLGIILQVNQIIFVRKLLVQDLRSPEECYILEYDAMRPGRSSPTFRNNVLPPSYAWFLLVTYLAYSSTVKMEAVRSSETSVTCYRITEYHIAEDSNLRSHYCDTFK